MLILRLLVGFFVHLLDRPLYGNWRCPARLFCSSPTRPPCDSPCFPHLLSFGVFFVLFLIFCSAQIEDRVKRLSCFCGPEESEGRAKGRVGPATTTHAGHNASLALWQMCFLLYFSFATQTRGQTEIVLYLSRGCNKCKRHGSLPFSLPRRLIMAGP